MMLAAVLSGTAAVPVSAQVVPHAGVEVTTDERRRGLSWSEGKAAAAAWVRADLPPGFDLGARVTTTRGDPRSGGAEAVIEPTLGYARDLGGFRLDGFVTGHVFTGGIGGMSYVEGGAGASYTLGPAEVGAEARYAPSQGAIGGDNLYLGARARLGVPATPWTIVGTVGRSTGDVNDPVRAARLRPTGRYHDWSLGVQRISGPLTLGLTYSGTDISDDGPDASPFAVRRHAGDRIAARVSVGF
ncbi:TorF family putative porin [Sphingomonas adhaesiva]|uniref:TorF family putative porin n=1 Tax=Sphingomonas adhaesiva TaxID=28212 RepID=UPI002FF92FDC